jgi:hypothetical protein
MQLLFRLMCIGALLAGFGTSGQDANAPPIFPPKEDLDHKLPNGKSQKEEILKADYQKTLKDSADLVSLSQELQKELESNNSHVLSIASLKKTEEIERIAKRIHGRLLRF